MSENLQTAVSLSEREERVKMLRQWGGPAVDAILDLRTLFFSVPGMPGFIGYRLIGKIAVVFGDPVCPPEAKEELAKAFHLFLEKEGMKAVYLLASSSFAKQAGDKVVLEFGKEVIFDPACSPLEMTGEHAQLVRRKVKKAMGESVAVQECLLGDHTQQKAMEEVGEKWLQSRKGLQLHISNVHLFEDSFGKRWFYAAQNGKTIGVVTINFLEAKQGWLLNHLMVLPDAPKGTSELLIVSVFEILQKEGCRYVTVGAVPKAELGEIRGLSPFLEWLIRFSFKHIYRWVHLSNLDIFWEKFGSSISEPTYILLQHNVGLRGLFALKKVLSE